jgi:hypothetical protein
VSTTPLTPPVLRTNEPEPLPAPAPPRVSGSGYLECDFCRCKLTKTGEVYQVSDVARDFRDDKEKHAKQIAKLDEEITVLRAQIAAKDAEIAQLKGSPGQQPAKQKFL